MPTGPETNADARLWQRGGDTVEPHWFGEFAYRDRHDERAGEEPVLCEAWSVGFEQRREEWQAADEAPRYLAVTTAGRMDAVAAEGLILALRAALDWHYATGGEYPQDVDPHRVLTGLGWTVPGHGADNGASGNPL